MADAMKLLPCPFCGGANVRVKEQPRHGTYAICDDCAAAGPYKKVTGSNDEAAAAWNRRAFPPAPDEGAIEAVMEVRIANPSGWTTPSRQEAEKLVQAALRNREFAK